MQTCESSSVSATCSCGSDHEHSSMGVKQRLGICLQLRGAETATHRLMKLT